MHEKTKTFLRLFAVVVTLSVVAAACSSESSSSQPGGGSTPAESGGETLDVSGMTDAEVDAADFSFTPSTLTGTAGQTLTLTVKNDGGATHTFTIDGTDVDVELQPGDEQQVSVTFPDSGSTEFYCRFHVGSGMKGTLTVA